MLPSLASVRTVPCLHNHLDAQGTIASEEEDLPVAVEETYSGNYVVVFDPLDGCDAHPSPDPQIAHEMRCCAAASLAWTCKAGALLQHTVVSPCHRHKASPA